MKECPACGRETDPAGACPKVPWYFRGSFIFFGFLVAGPLILPLVWFHPRYGIIKKLVTTGVILILTMALFTVFNESIKSIKHSYQQLRALPATGSQDALSVIHARKSVRSYTTEPVSQRDIDTLLRAGMAAPTAGDKRPWAFVAVTDKNKLNEFAEVLPYAGMLSRAGAAIVVCGIPGKSFSGKAGEFWIQDCSAATENILLAAEALHLGAVWIGIHPFQERVNTVRKALGIPDEVTVLCVVSIGHPGGQEKPKNKYNPDNIHWNHW